MRILIATVQVPFIRGGAEIHAEGLRDALVQAGHEAEILAIPFKWYPPEKILDHMLACRLLDATEVAGTRVDRLIGLRFPAYLIPHPNKVLWILHQHRTAYDLWDHTLSDLVHYPNGSQVRDAIQQADRKLIPEARAVFANSHNVAQRLKRYCDIDATPLYQMRKGFIRRALKITCSFPAVFAFPNARSSCSRRLPSRAIRSGSVLPARPTIPITLTNCNRLRGS
jgi:hypothetical protein